MGHWTDLAPRAGRWGSQWALVVNPQYVHDNPGIRPKGTSEQVYELTGRLLDDLAFLYYFGSFLLSWEGMREKFIL